MGWNYLSIPKLQRCNRWSLGMDEQFHLRLNWACNYLSMMGLKLIHVSKSGHRFWVLNIWGAYTWHICVRYIFISEKGSSLAIQSQCVAAKMPLNCTVSNIKSTLRLDCIATNFCCWANAHTIPLNDSSCISFMHRNIITGNIIDCVRYE